MTIVKRVANGKRRETGLTLIELMMALFVLAVGMAAGMILVSTAIASNNRNKLDTTATLLAQTVLERIIAAGANATTPFTMTDCLGNNFTIDPTGLPAPGKGPTVVNGQLNFTGNAPAGYGMMYNVCRAAGQTARYDVRWNVTTITMGSPTPYTKYVTVAARPAAAAGNTGQNILFYGLPVTLRGISANSMN